jgi:hypothetical protein
MGLNDDELTPREHDDMRSRLLAGARTIQPVGSHRTAWISSTVAVALVAALAGGVFGVSTLLKADEPDPVSTSSPSPTSSPSVTPTTVPTAEPTAPGVASRGVMPFGGECVNVLTDAEATAAAGQAMHRSDFAWQTGELASSGGIDCLWLSTDDYLGALVDIYAYPDELVPADVRAVAKTGCEPSKDGERIICDVSGVRDGVWLLVRTTGKADAVSPAGTQAAFDAAAERIDDFAAPEIAVPTESWWTALDCDELAAQLDPSTYGFDDIRVIDYSAESPPTTPHPNQISSPAHAASSCDLSFTSGSGSENQSGTGVWVATVSGGAVTFDTAEAAEGGRPVEVDGALSARFVPGLDRYEGSWHILAVSDGVNVLMLSDGGGSEPNLTLLVGLAEELLSRLG